MNGPRAPEALLLPLAAAVCDTGHRARLISADNAGGRQVPWETAESVARRGMAAAGRVRSDTIALDLDLSGDHGDDQVRTEVLGQLVAELLEAGAEPLVVRSGRPGNRHVFCTGAGPELTAKVIHLARETGIDVRAANALIRPPGWPHRLGAGVSVAAAGAETFTEDEGATEEAWHRALVVLEEGRARRAAAGPDSRTPSSVPGEETQRSTERRLSDRLWGMVRHGDVDGRYRRHGETDRSALTLAICNVAVLTNVHPDHLWNLLRRPENLGGAGLRARIETRGLEGGQKWFRKLWEKAHDGRARGGQAGDRAGAIERIVELTELATRTTFPGVSGSTDRAVLGACHAVGALLGSLYVPLPKRSIAVRAGIGAGTASRSLRRLRAQGWLSLARTAREDRGAVFLLTAPAAHTGVREASAHSGTSSPLTGGVGGGPIVREVEKEVVLDAALSGPLRGLAAHDAFHRAALGKGCLETLSALSDDDWLGSSDVAAATGKHPGTVRRHLVRLRSAGLVEWDPTAHAYRRSIDTVSLPDQLEAVAVEAGTAGAGRRRALRFELERRGYRLWLKMRLERVMESPTPMADGSEQTRFDLHPRVPAQRRGPPRRRVA